MRIIAWHWREELSLKCQGKPDSRADLFEKIPSDHAQVISRSGLACVLAWPKTQRSLGFN